jgi:hypothetical protein
VARERSGAAASPPPVASVAPASCAAGTEVCWWIVKDDSTGHALVTRGVDATSPGVLAALGVSSASGVSSYGCHCSFVDAIDGGMAALGLQIDTFPTVFKPAPGTDIMRLNYDAIAPFSAPSLPGISNPLDAIGGWAVRGAQSILAAVESAATSVSTPELSSAWFTGLFKWVVFYAALLALLFAAVGLVVAAVRRDPEVVTGVVYGIVRAGLVTGAVVPLTIIVLTAVDGLCAELVKAMPASAFAALSDAWGSSGAGAFASGILAFLGALVEILVAIVLLVELLFRDAAIYVSVLFFPVVLAMAVFPSLRGAQARMTQILGAFIAFKPVALLTLLAGVNILAGGVSLAGQAASVGTILSGIAVIALAALSPWTAMFMLGISGAMHSTTTGRIRDEGRAGGGALSGGSVEAAGGDLAGSSPAGGQAVASSAAEARPRPAGGMIAAAAGWLGAAADVGGLVAAHAGERVGVAAGHPGSSPPRPAWSRASTAGGTAGGTAGTAGGRAPDGGAQQGVAAGPSITDPTPDLAAGHASTSTTDPTPEPAAGPERADPFGREKEEN